VPGESSSSGDQVRTAEVIAALCLATDLGMGLPLEHGLHSTLVAMRLGERLGVDNETASQIYYACLLFYIGCTADAEISAELFEDGALLTHFSPVMFGTRAETTVGIMRALSGSGSGLPTRALRVATRLPRAVRGYERPRDAAFQHLLGGEDFAVRVIRGRAGGAFDPAITTRLADEAADIMSLDDELSAWDETLAREPAPQLTLHAEAIDQALAAMGDFADLASPYLVGHSAGVAELAAAAAQRRRLPPAEVVSIRRAALVHDVGRVAIPARIWQKPGALSRDEWERVRLHPYHTERVLSGSPFLAALAPIATSHHERLDGSGYHRGAGASALAPPARLLAAADAYHAMTEPRPHRGALSARRAAEVLAGEASAGRLDAESVAAVLEAAGHRAPRVDRPAGLTEREAQVVALLARGLQTKQVGRALGISVKTADRHVQNAYAKIGISTRAAAALFAMQHGLVTWGELPIVSVRDRS
jgi:HD-GYP domain-containing protein (c-di-GMP phosphodiesterase class II)